LESPVTTIKFTDKIAQYIKQEALDLNKLVLVLPSERATKYIARSLYNAFGKPIFSPEMITIDRWVRSCSSRPILDRTRLLIKLFNIQRETYKDAIDQSFDDFLNWGGLLLADYDEIERYLLDSKAVFTNLLAVKELEGWDIESWSFEPQKLTEAQKRFMEFWDRLPIFFKQLVDQLKAEDAFFMGQAYRELAEEIDRAFIDHNDKIFLFAGFNALSPAELSIMKQLQNLGRAHILWDTDAYYLDNPLHEAGAFLRHNLTQLGINDSPVPSALTETNKHIRIIECTQRTGQVKAAATILSELNAEQLNDTLLLLADEQLISVLLKNIPASVGKANLTLGLPLRLTAIKTWVDLFFSFQENALRFKTTAIYFKDLQKFLSHPFIYGIMDEKERAQHVKLEQEIIKKNKLFIRRDGLQLSKKIKDILDLIATPWEMNWKHAVQSIRQVNFLLNHSFIEQDEFEQALIEAFDGQLLDFENIVSEGIPDMQLRSFKSLFNQHWSNRSLAYYGTPLGGLQVMGLLETRLLDFKHVIMIGVNEGNVPATNPIQTMIPMDLRKYFGLPTPREKQGLFAHHFYRLFHHAEDVWITYSSGQDAMMSTEKSRYVTQLELELNRLNKSNILIDHQQYVLPLKDQSFEANVDFSVEKTQDIFNRMDEVLQKSFSASAMKKYITCPLDFYYRYILDFKEEEDVSEEVEHSDFGTFIHDVLEELYTPFVRHDKNGKLISPAPSAILPHDIDQMLNRFEHIMEKRFLKHFNDDPQLFSTGKNFLSYKMALELTKRILLSEKAFLESCNEPVFIEYLEVVLQDNLNIPVNEKEKQVNLFGIVDRIDSVGGRYRIIDYKSGSVSAADVTCKPKESVLETLGGPKHVLQLLLYAHLFKKNFGIIPDQACIYSLVNVKEGLFPLSSELPLTDLIALIPEFLQELLTDMYMIEQPFRHTEQRNSYCLHCLN
jgi:ATP-dependent helicase/nuclease subunit B